METNRKWNSVALASVALILFLILVSSTASATTEQGASSAGTYAYITNENSNTVSVIDTATNIVVATVSVGRHMPFGVAVTPDGRKAYVTHQYSNKVSVIDTATNTVTATVFVGYDPIGIAVSPDGKNVYVAIQYPSIHPPIDAINVIDTATDNVTATVKVGTGPVGVAVNPMGTKVYVTNEDSNNVSVVDTATNNVTASVPVGSGPFGIAVTPDGKKVYVTNFHSNDVSVIDTSTNAVTATLPVGSYPVGVAVNPTGTKVYVANEGSNIVSVIDTATNKVTATVPVGYKPIGITVMPDGSKVYVANSDSNNVSVINTTTNTVTATVSVGSYPVAFGQFIGPLAQPVLPVSNFSSNLSEGYAPLSVQFTDLSKNATSVSWDFDNNGVIDSIESNPVHEFTTAGIYTVNLTATNENGTDSKLATINVTEKLVPIIPIANFSSNVSEGYAPLSVQFTDLSENATEWKWNFGDEGISDQQNPIHTFSTSGIYTVNLTVSNANGTDSKLATITISEQPEPVLPVANFSSNVSEGYVPLSVQFTDLSENATEWKWNFGDESASDQQNPMHTFSAAGIYTVNLTVSNANGTDSKLATITVLEKTILPVANFSANPTSGKSPLTVAFTDTSTGTPTKWKWSFGDGKTSTAKSPKHKYSKAGDYPVKLTVTNAAGSNTVTKAGYIQVIEKPVAAFSAEPTSGKVPLTAAFTDKSTGTPTKWKWTFGDGKISTAKSPKHKYLQEGSYKVTLTVTNTAGSNTATKTNYIKVTTSTRPGIYSENK